MRSDIGLRLLPLLPLVAGQSSGSCKSLPGDAVWPSPSDWGSLNATVQGRLLATIPVASVCHSSGDFAQAYDEAACDALKPIWNYPEAQFVLRVFLLISRICRLIRLL